MASNKFEGWYFKQQAGENMTAFIPAIHTNSGKRTGSVQVIMPGKAYYVEVPPESIKVHRRPFAVTIGNSTFTMGAIDLDVHNGEVTVKGSLRYTRHVLPAGDIMGPYRFVPLMECRHSVFSLAHEVAGLITINGNSYDYAGGLGYIEGDRGCSFPSRYIWTQCSWHEKTGTNGLSSESCALMLSAAEVRPLGKPFTGIIGFVLFRGHELRFATYRGAKILSARNGMISVRQGNYILTAQLLESREQALRAPVSGKMIRLIKESLACRVRYTLSENGGLVLDFVSEQASFEYEF